MAKDTGKKIIAGLVGTAIIAGAGVAGGMAIQNAYGKPDAGDNTQTEAPAVDYEKIELQEKLAEVQAQLTESQSLLQAKTTAYNQLKETTDAEIANLNEQITAKETAIEEANAELEQVTGNLTIAQETVATLTAEKESLESQLETETANKEAVQAQLNTVNAQLETAQANVTNLTAQVETLIAEKAQLETDKQTLANEKADLQQQLEDAEAEVVILNARIVELENILESDENRDIYDLLFTNQTLYSHKLPNGDYLVSSESGIEGIYIVSGLDYSTRHLTSFGKKYMKIETLADNYILAYGSSYAVLYNYINEDISEFSISASDTIYKTQDSKLVFMWNNLQYGNLQCLDVEEKTIETVKLSTGTAIMASFNIFEISNGNCVIGTPGTLGGVTATWYFTRENKTVELITSNYGLLGLYEYNGSLLCMNRDKGFKILNLSDNSIISLDTSAAREVANVIPLNNIGSEILMVSASYGKGIYYYNFETAEFKVINTEFSQQRDFMKVGEKRYLLLGTYYMADIDLSTDSCNLIIKNSCSNLYFHDKIYDNKVFIVHPYVYSSDYGIDYFDLETGERKSFTEVYTYNFDTYVEDENGVTISSSTDTQNRKVYYSYATRDFTVVTE